MSDRIKFSIVIPVYNVEPYIRTCLDSILNQTFGDFEVVCVDDGSTDKSLAILREYEAKDGRIKVYTEENLGSGVARNYGISMAKGEYLVFIDPDDWVEPDYLETVLDTFNKTGVEIVQFDYKKINEISKKEQLYIYQHENKKFGGKKNLFKEPYYNWCDFKDARLFERRAMVWDKVYLMDFIKENKLEFAPTKHGEDNLFSFGAILKASKVFYLNKVLYNYRFRPGSAVNRKSADLFCVIDNIRYLKEFLEQNNFLPELMKDFTVYKTKQIWGFYYNVPDDKKSEYLDKVKNVLSDKEFKELNDKIKNKGFSWLEKVFSMKNRYDNAKKSKIITILGVKITINA